VSEADPAADRSPDAEVDAGDEAPLQEYPDVTDGGDLSELIGDASEGGSSDGGDEAAVVEAVAVAEAIAKERDEYLDLARRVQADFENYKRRVDQQRSEQRERAAEDLARELLPVLDAGEAAAAQGMSDAEQLHLHLLTTLEKRGLTRVAEEGVEFDPNRHEAVIHEEGDEAAPVVVEVLRTGYLWNERVLRPAMVKARG